MDNPQFILRADRRGQVNIYYSLIWKLVNSFFFFVFFFFKKEKETSVHFSSFLSLEFPFFMNLWVTPTSDVALKETKNPFLSENGSLLPQLYIFQSINRSINYIADRDKKKRIILDKSNPKYEEKVSQKTTPQKVCKQQERLQITEAVRGGRGKRLDYWWPCL